MHTSYPNESNCLLTLNVSRTGAWTIRWSETCLGILEPRKVIGGEASIKVFRQLSFQESNHFINKCLEIHFNKDQSRTIVWFAYLCKWQHTQIIFHPAYEGTMPEVQQKQSL